jgi:hypothetical protein
MEATVKANTSKQGYAFDSVEFEKHLITFEGKEILHDTRDDYDSLNEVMLEIKFAGYKEFHKLYYCNHTYSDTSIWFIVIDGKAIAVPHYINVPKLMIEYVSKNTEEVTKHFCN